MSQLAINTTFSDDCGTCFSDSPNIPLTLPLLYKALVKYSTTSNRLLFIKDSSVFEDFHLNNEIFPDLSTFELSSKFLNEVLPKLHNYLLPETNVNELRLLNLNPWFQTRHCHEPQNSSLCNVLESSDFNYSKKLLKLLKQGRSSESHTMLIACDAEARSSPKFQISLDIASLLSTMLSTEVELSVALLHSFPEVKKRLRDAKLKFENTADMQPYRINCQLIADNTKIFKNIENELCSVFYSV